MKKQASKKLVLYLLLLLLVVVIPACSADSYPIKKAIANGDVVSFNEIHNLDKFLRFVTNVELQQEDKLRITSYTDEGDPIFMDLHFDGSVIHYTYDNSLDTFGGQNKGKYVDTCTGITKKESDLGSSYTLSGCTIQSPNAGYHLLLIRN